MNSEAQKHPQSSAYRGRIAPSPTGYLHLGHARTFWRAQQRATERDGILVLRNEDLDQTRCRSEFVNGMIEDLHWFGFRWQEGPDCGGPFAPYVQSQRLDMYRKIFEDLKSLGVVYPCSCSRQDVLRSVSAPHAADDEPIYPGTCRHGAKAGDRISWRFRVRDGEKIEFTDANLGGHEFIAGKDFGDFVVWRHDDIPAYQLAVVTDDHLMNITEVVRGADLLVSTARQILLYRALGWSIPAFYHCALMTDENGVRLAKRNDALSLRTLRARGQTPEELRKNW